MPRSPNERHIVFFKFNDVEYLLPILGLQSVSLDKACLRIRLGVVGVDVVHSGRVTDLHDVLP